MAKAKALAIKWLADIEDHDYPAAASYLSLIYPEAKVAKIVARLRKARMSEFKAKDILRASQLSSLGMHNAHVIRDQKKIMKGKALSPLLLVRAPEIGRVIVADGYHRLCAVHELAEDAEVPCKIV
jgi:hypothetical protein